MQAKKTSLGYENASYTGPFPDYETASNDVKTKKSNYLSRGDWQVGGPGAVFGDFY